jgi:hypothetical protein
MADPNFLSTLLPAILKSPFSFAIILICKKNLKIFSPEIIHFYKWEREISRNKNPELNIFFH